MTLAFWCVLVAVFLPLIFVGFAKLGSRDYNNRDVRGWEETLTGYRRRAHQAQLNSYEAFPPFAAGVIIAHLAGGDPGWINGLAVGFVVLRAIYGWCYITDRATMRSIVWILAFFVMVGLYILPIM